MNKNVKYIDVEKLCKLLESKIEQGYAEIEKLPITDTGCARAVVNMLEFDTTIQQLKVEGRFQPIVVPVIPKATAEIQEAWEEKQSVEMENE